MAEDKEGKKKVITVKLPAINLWMIVSLVLLVVLVLDIAGFLPFRTTGMFVLGTQDAAKKAIDFINNNVVQTGTVELVSVKEFSGIYEVITTYQGQQIPIYVTKDGSAVFLSQPLNITQVISTKTNTTSTASEIPKTEKPTVDLYVMGFCPYGVQAETTMKPVFDLLGTQADIKVHFITSITGTTVDSVQSLHGATEAQEDLRQVCIMKNYDQKTYWTYLMEIDNNCYGVISTTNATALDACWKAAATKAGIDASKIDTCSKGSEGLDLLKADEQLTTTNGVTGSPTLIINGVTYNGARTSEDFKNSICSGFTTQPAECSQTLSATGTEASGGCAS